MARRCTTHHMCDCTAERMRELEAKLNDLQARHDMLVADHQGARDLYESTIDRALAAESRLDKYKAALTEIMRGSYAGASFIAQEALLNAEPLVVERSVRHVCGLEGYNGMIDPPCPGCESDKQPM